MNAADTIAAVRSRSVTSPSPSPSTAVAWPSCRGLNLNVRPGECLVIVGASGSGKTTLLRVLAGLEAADSGDVLIDGAARARRRHRARRDLPGATAAAVADGARERGLRARGARRARRPQAEDAGAALHRASSASASSPTPIPSQLSGGMAQRVGIARALTVQPEILLLDEPLGALDAMTKITMQEELARIWREENVTMVMVTHDLEEAIYLADRVLVLPKEKGGVPRLLEVDLPRPRERSGSRFVRYREELLREFGLH